MNRRVAQVALVVGASLTCGAIACLLYARFGWRPNDPVALGGATGLGMFVGGYFTVVALVASKRVDNTITANRPGVAVVVRREQRIDPDLLGLADEAGVRGGGR